MDIEHEVKLLPLNDKLQTAAEELSKDGWQQVPGFPPMVIYHLIRDKDKAGAGIGKMHIDDTKVHVIKANGQVQ